MERAPAVCGKLTRSRWACLVSQGLVTVNMKADSHSLSAQQRERPHSRAGRQQSHCCTFIPSVPLAHRIGLSLRGSHPGSLCLRLVVPG